MNKLYAFSVNHIKKDNQEINIFSYEQFFNRCFQLGLMIVYKYKHTGAKGDHTHFHGVISSSHMIDYHKFDDLQKTVYSIDFKIIKTQKDFDNWHQYCRHEEIEYIQKLEGRSKQLKESDVLNNFIERLGEYDKPKQTKIKVSRPKGTGMKIIIQGGLF